MNTQDETIIREEQNDANGKSSASRWQTVSIGGVVGIAMGMAATRAYDAFAADEGIETATAEETADGGQAETTAESESTATEVHQAAIGQELSFSDAFAAARAEVGPGGVFMWHGRLYNTYTAAEWNAMSDEQKDEFADNVQPLLAQQTVETQHVEHQADNHTGGTDSGGEEVHVEEVADREPEVHFLGVDSREIEGQTVNVGIMTVDNENVAFVDVDNDQVFDIRIQDDNHNDKIEDEEVEDVSDRNLSVDDFRMLSELDGKVSQTGELEQASNAQEDLAPEMPDYMNDAELGTI